jgi:drug/metabolite transporter (DMT)-like permease
MSSATAVPTFQVRRSNKPMFMVVGCTLFASAAQVLMKMGSVHEMPRVDPAHLNTLVDFVLALTGNIPLICGFSLHGCNAVLLIFALKSGELSILWPLYALSYVWVAFLSAYFFGDRINAWKVAGIALIILGVALLGRASTRDGYKVPAGYKERA